MNKIKYIIENWIYRMGMEYQRIVSGHTDEDIWNFDMYSAQLINEATFKLAEECHGHPDNLTEKKWKQILFDISFGFGSYIEMRSGAYSYKDKEFKRLSKEYKKGLQLFAKYHEHLWD